MSSLSSHLRSHNIQCSQKPGWAQARPIIGHVNIWSIVSSYVFEIQNVAYTTLKSKYDLLSNTQSRVLQADLLIFEKYDNFNLLQSLFVKITLVSFHGQVENRP